MSSVAKLKRRAAELEQKKQHDKALDLYIQILDEGGRELDDGDVPLYNRVGDLLTRSGRVHDALGYYERAVDVYAERGYLNNAIALCNKILRQSPGRTAVYYKLGKISASKGFKSDARKNFLEYADRMQKSGNLEEAVRALKEFASFYPDEEDIRLMLAEQLSKENRKGEAIEQLQALYDKLESEGRQAEARATVDRMKAIDPSVVPRQSGSFRTQKQNVLVFLDLSEREREPRPQTPPENAVSKAPPLQSRVPALEGLSLTFVPDDDSTVTASTVSPVEGFTTTAQPGAPREKAVDRGNASASHGGDASADQATTESTAAPVTPDGVLPIPVDLNETPSPPLELSQPIELGVGPPAKLLEVDMPEAVDMEGRRAGPEPHDPLTLSGLEFAELDLAEIPRQPDSRAHDLALPTLLPLLDEATERRMGDDQSEGIPSGTGEQHSGTSEEDRAFAISDFAAEPEIVDTPESPDRPESAVAQPPTDPHYRRGVVLTDPDFRAVDGDLPVAADAPQPTTPRVPSAPPAPLDGLPDRDVGDTSREHLGDARELDDLVDTPATFGGQADPNGPAFPPIPGLSDEALGSTGAPEYEGSRRRRKRGRRLDSAPTAPPAAGSLPAPEPSPSRMPNEQAAAGTPSARVEAPLPQGFESVMGGDKGGAPGQQEGGDGSGANPATSSHTVAPRPAPARTPPSTVRLGGADAQLRRRLELDPENWPLRRQLGEALLDAGKRDEGLYELELAMVGFELTRNLDQAQEVADVIIRVLPASVRHHQKRVEYAVRSKDRIRLVEAYLELADALFRTGEGDKSVAVYARVVELSPENERALFALATLAPDELARLHGGASRAGRWSEELDVIPEGGTFAHPADEVLQPLVEGSQSAVSASAVTPVVVDVLDDTPAPADVARIEVSAAEPPGRHTVAAETSQGPASLDVAPLDVAPLDVAPLDVAPLDVAPLDAALTDAASPDHTTPQTAPDETAADGDIATPLAVEAQEDTRDTPERGVDEAFPSPSEATSTSAERSEPRILDRARSMTPSPESADFVDLGDWLRQTEPARSTRMVVDDAKPTGDERADFEEMLRRFKRGVAENVDEQDFVAHYDLGVAFKEMGLLDEAIAQFQKALRGREQRVRAYEALGQCFVEKAQYPIAAALLQRAVESPDTDDQQLVGVLYLLGFAHEQTGRHADALRYYQRVFAVDLEFRDITQRVSAMEQLTK